ncbi:Beta-(1--_2)glucan export ATP-binding/permease protein NdvA [compost metagenome]
MAILPIKYLLIWLVERRRSKYVMELIDANKELSLWLNDIFDGVYEVKLWNMTEEKEQKYEELLSHINNLELKKYRIDRIKQGMNAILENAFLNIIYILGGILIWREEFSLGGIIAFITYSSYLIEPITLSLELKIILSEIKPSLKAYIDFMDLEEEESPKILNAIEFRNSSPNFIEFRDVSFSYNEENTIKNFDLKISRGEKVAFIGRNGSGKTTLMNLLLRFYEPTSGDIYMDNNNINTISLKDYRDLFSVMPQSSFLFNTSVLNNLTMFGKVNVDKSQLGLDGERDSILGFISRLPNKLETKVGINGSMLSGGEKQKLIFSRVIQKKSKILILDEVTSNYDSQSERQFEEIIENCTAFEFMILITHRVNILQKMDRIVLLEEGRIISAGSFQKLYQEESRFREIINENSLFIKGDFAHGYNIQNV